MFKAVKVQFENWTEMQNITYFSSSKQNNTIKLAKGCELNLENSEIISKKRKTKVGFPITCKRLML